MGTYLPIRNAHCVWNEPFVYTQGKQLETPVCDAVCSGLGMFISKECWCARPPTHIVQTPTLALYTVHHISDMVRTHAMNTVRKKIEWLWNDWMLFWLGRAICRKQIHPCVEPGMHMGKCIYIYVYMYICMRVCICNCFVLLESLFGCSDQGWMMLYVAHKRNFPSAHEQTHT